MSYTAMTTTRDPSYTQTSSTTTTTKMTTTQTNIWTNTSTQVNTLLISSQFNIIGYTNYINFIKNVINIY